ARHRCETFADGFRPRACLLLANHFTRLAEHAVPAPAIPQIQTDGQLTLQILLACFHRSASLLHVPVSLSVCALSASITWERTASRLETGLLIPSVCDNNRRSRCQIKRIVPIKTLRHTVVGVTVVLLAVPIVQLQAAADKVSF